jgi:uncharacterized protein (TIGR02271 family)
MSQDPDRPNEDRASLPLDEPSVNLAQTAAPPEASGPFSADPDVTAVGTLQLREEVIQIGRERSSAGQVSFRREVRTRTETVTTELRREVLIIEIQPGGPAVFLQDEELKPGETREVVLYDEQTVVSKVPFITEEVHIGKRTVTAQQQHEVELQYEVLAVDEHPPELQ